MTKFEFKKYHKINSLFYRDENKDFIFGKYSMEEYYALRESSWIIKEKIDGTNIRIGWDGEKVLINGKTNRANLLPGLIAKLQELFPVQKFIDLQYPPMIIYGEGLCRKGARKSFLYLEKDCDYDFIAFDIRINDIWLEPHNIDDICNKLKVRAVQWTACYPDFTSNENLIALFFDLTGRFSYVPEGVVATPKGGLLTRTGERIITKIKVDDFKDLGLSFRKQIDEYNLTTIEENKS